MGQFLVKTLGAPGSILSATQQTIAKMQEVSRHKKVEVLLHYVRSAELFDDHAGDGFL